MSEQIEQSIIGMYSRGMSTRHIEDQIREVYGVDVSESTVFTVTNCIVDHIKEWQIRPLEPFYFTCWMDGIQFKIRHNGKVVNKCIYLVIGLKNDGLKEILGMWINETESASFWLSVFTDHKERASRVFRRFEGKIYGAINKQATRDSLNDFAVKCGNKYGYAITSWENNWETLTSYFDFPLEIRKVIYTTNVIESLNSGIRKFTKAKSLFTDD